MTDRPSPDRAAQGSDASAPAAGALVPEQPGELVPQPGEPVSPRPSARPVQYKGSELDAERGPGLGCFRFQVAILAILIVLTPVGVSLNWPSEVSALLLFITIGLLLLTGQTIIFLLRLVAADRRGRRRPLASQTKTVGELEDERRMVDTSGAGDAVGMPEVTIAAEPKAPDDVRQ